MAKKQMNQIPTEGQDTFLDIVANLVGILIILIMVIGIRAKEALLLAENPSESSVATDNQSGAEEILLSSVSSDEIASLKHRKGEVEKRVAHLHEEITSAEAKGQEIQKILKDQEDNLTHTKEDLILAETELAQNQNRMGEALRQQTIMTTEINKIQREYQNRLQEKKHLQQKVNEVHELRHTHTPVANLEKGNVLYFRLQGGKVTYVPIDELLEQLKHQAQQVASGMGMRKEVTSTVGPVLNFNMRYLLRRSDQQTGGIELKRFLLIPDQGLQEEDIALALHNPNSRFQQYLALVKPESTSLVFWTYSDSFQEYRQVQEYLQERGFSHAGRPLPLGRYISGGPDGSNAAVQ
ncbi:MAG: hypothetical protein MPJ24_01650 [Pirellulaceae bacterium]|nr:hypothetical protein [Pirellulaceae bacterium]